MGKGPGKTLRLTSLWFLRCALRLRRRPVLPLRRRPERLRRRPERPRPVLHLRRRRRRGSGEDLRGRGWVGPEGSGGGRWVGGGGGDWRRHWREEKTAAALGFFWGRGYERDLGTRR